MPADSDQSQSLVLGFTRYQWLVLLAAWLGWGFDAYDVLLFNYVAPLCVPDLLGIARTGKEAAQAVTLWTGLLTSLMLVGWAIGGILFGRLTDQIGRTRCMILTMVTFALATAACATATDIRLLALFRFVAALGIGGEWAAGAALVAETVPESKRVPAGALLYSSAPMGLFLATFVNDLFTRQLDLVARHPQWPSLGWRVVFLTGLLPAAVALLVRLGVHESERWAADRPKRPQLRELFTPELRRRTIGGLALACVSLLTWWSCNAFIPLIASFLATDVHAAGAATDLARLKTHFITAGTTWFNLGGLIGVFLTVPVALTWGRRRMFVLYFALSTAAILVTFAAPVTPQVRLYLMFLLGLTVFAVLGTFTYYLPELFPVRLRGTGSGFCYNFGRFIAALGPFAVGAARSSSSSATDLLATVSWVALAPAAGLLLVLLGVGVETRDRAPE
jgi:MFS family permease